ncbi:glycosyltransferase family 2 protein [Desulfopila sp. IMCC35008]|uniref:glycosyltransferase n=1 Tax=Desulfopila sp. IMCC35008 TaxID=2653858 RepID=UPI0013D615E7|nr:glycosyltransferase [Desulfopila sp. IMCC35008]
MTFSIILLLTALLFFIIHLYVFIDIIAGLSRMGLLREKKRSAGEQPKVTVIVPACNEEKTIGPALQSLLSQDYSNLEIAVVDDRSDDTTGEVVATMQPHSRHPLRLLRIDHLPEDWLGKPHALQKAAEQSEADIFLFTDADIMMERSSISRAVAAMIEDNIDHLSVTFQPLGNNFLLNAMILDAASGLLALFKPWKVDNNKNRYFFGVGAFNMIRAGCYFECGGHRTIKMHPIDDLMLGKIVKQNGFRQKCLLGYRMITVHWYNSVPEMVDGLAKNSFSVFHYRPWLAALSVCFMFLVAALPFGGMVLVSGPAFWLFAGTFTLRLTGFALGAILCRMAPLTLIGAIFAPFITLYIVARAAVKTIRNKGITWRGTFYPLNKLRKSAPLLF